MYVNFFQRETDFDTQTVGVYFLDCVIDMKIYVRINKCNDETLCMVCKVYGRMEEKCVLRKVALYGVPMMKFILLESFIF